MFLPRVLLAVSLLALLTLGSSLKPVHKHVHIRTHLHKRRHQTRNSNGSLHAQTGRAASYTLRDNYTSNNFFSGFEFFTGQDPTHGYVAYQSEAAARSQGLINTNQNMVYLGVDYKTVNPPAPGRASVRITSKKSYNHGLFIADIQHMPGSACGIWPAFWMFGPDWPGSGEIDIIENVHLATTNLITLHSAPGCTINTSGSRSGTTLTQSNCNAGNGNNGCSATTQAPFGDKFNAGSGGVYAVQWESAGIYVWFFPRNAIPADIKALKPDTSKWGAPLVSFNGGAGCNIDKYFKNQNIVFDTTFCGDWAGNTWGSSTCASRANSCQAYVAGNPGAFKSGYWKINSVRVYQR